MREEKRVNTYRKLLGQGPDAHPKQVDYFYQELKKDERFWWLADYESFKGRQYVVNVLLEEMGKLTLYRQMVLRHYFGLADGQPKNAIQIALLIPAQHVDVTSPIWRLSFVVFRRYLEDERQERPVVRLQSPIERLEVSTQALNVLKRGRLRTVQDVRSSHRIFLNEIDRMGRVTLAEIEAAMARVGFPMD